MKNILLTVTPEQLQKSIEKLETRVNDLDTVKELQDKIISYQDHQISFLNDSIANIWQPIAIVSGLIGLVMAYVAYSNRKAQENIKLAQTKMNEAETKMKTAEKALDKAEKKIQHLDIQLRQATDIVQEAKTIAVTAQHKLNELEKEQKDLKELTDTIQKIQNLEMILTKGRALLDSIGANKLLITTQSKKLKLTPEEETFVDSLYSQLEKLDEEHRDLEFTFSNQISTTEKPTNETAQAITKLYEKIENMGEKFINLFHRIEEQKEKQKQPI